ncbi:translation initiation factor IF-2, partial [Candidatus Woesearchaeota archaeon]|nr:translation initiation factor IF-2 [Candidatus Woesearchaeota archaeon]
MPLRSPICTIEGHVDHGKTSILDNIRGTSIAKSEAGAITQAIGASIIPLKTIKKATGTLLETLKMEITVPGLLFIDTPGHAAFTSLRKRGGNLADIAIVVIDINEGIMPQTQEAIEILKAYKTPFIIALNKIDLIKGYKESKSFLIQNLNAQDERVQKELETKLYEIVGKLHELGFESERFDRVQDYTKTIALVPTSAETGDGIPELLMVMTGLAQKYLGDKLECDRKATAKGIILEIKESKGLGKTLDVIIYNGCLKVNDTIVIGSLGEPIITKVKTLFQPAPLAEMRDKKAKFTAVKEVTAATGVKIAAKEIDEAVAGMPLHSATDANLEQTKEQVQKEVQEVLIETEADGVIVKADTLGSLEAMDNLLKEKGIPIRKATIGDISKKDLTEAESMYEKDPLQAVVLGFTVKIAPDVDVKSSKAKVITNDVIYKIIEDLEKWQEEETKRQEAKELETITKPCKLKMLGKGYIFRQNNPAVFGVEVLAGELKANTPVMKQDGSKLNIVKSIQAEQETVQKVEKGKQAAISVDGITIGRQLGETEILFSDISENDFRKAKELKKHLSEEEKQVLKEIAVIKRKENPVWGI